MVQPPQRFGRYLISQRASGDDVALSRSANEVVFLAFDTHIKRLVELHVMKSGTVMSSAEKMSALDRAAIAMKVRNPSFMRLLEAGENEGVVYFSSNLSDGEFAEEYVARRGALSSVTVFCLLQQFLDDLVSIQSYSRLLARIRVANPLITTLEDAFLQLRVVDYGFSEKEDPLDEPDLRGVFTDCCRLMFLLLTGQVYEGQNPDRFPVLTSLPTNLRAHMRTALVDASEASPSLERLRDHVREAYAAQVSSLQMRNSRKHIAMTEALQPASALQQLLLENVPAEDLLRGRFEVANGDDLRRYPFAIPAVNVKNEQPVTVHLLPPTRIVDRTQIEAVPLQMWRFSSDKHPNILRSLSLWENPEWTFLTEEREPGFTLSRLMAERSSFNPPEVLALLKQVRSGLEQAGECGVKYVDLHPSNLIFRVGKGGVMQAREFERLVTKRIDAWPPFVLKLRTHMTMRSLYEPLLAEPHPEAALYEEHLAAKDLRCRSVIGLAIYLLTGERQMGRALSFNEAVPDALAAYLRECEGAQCVFGRVPEVAEFIEAFERHMPHDESEGRGIAAILGARKVDVSEMESAGAVSDFDDDQPAESDEPSYLTNPIGRKIAVNALPAVKSGQRGVFGMALWGLAALFLGIVAWFLVFRGHAEPALAADPAASEKLPKPQASSPVAAAPTKPTTTGVKAEPVSKTPAPQPASAPVAPAPGRVRTPEEIRKAIVPSRSEVDKAVKGRPSGAVPERAPDDGGGQGLVEGRGSSSGI